MKGLSDFKKTGILFFTYFISQAFLLLMLYKASDISIKEIDTISYLILSTLTWLTTFSIFKFMFLDYCEKDNE